jgi:predicted phage tail component-like protein
MSGFVLDVTFNDKSLKEDFEIGLLSYTVQSSPSRKSKGIDIPGRDGTYKVDSKYSSKKIELSVVVEAATPEEVHEKIRKFFSWLSQQDQPKVTFTDNKKIFVYADFDEADEYYVTRGMDNAMTHLGFTLYQYDPFSYDKDIVSYDFECTPGKIYEIANSGIHTPYMVYMTGTKEAMTQYMATSVGHSTLSASEGASICSNIRLTINGVDQIYKGTLTDEDILLIDGDELEVTKNGVSAITDWEGDIQDLVYGNNTLIMTNLENVSVFLRVEFYRRWV